MRAVRSESIQRRLRAACVAGCIVAVAPVVSAQTVVPVFSTPVDVRLSTNGTTVAAPNTFGTALVNLSCPAGEPISATLSGPLPSGSTTPTDLLVDNYLNLTANGTTTNLCAVYGPGPGNNPASCFRSAYADNVAVGQDPDTLAPGGGVLGGVAPIDVSSYLVPGNNEITFDTIDFGGFLASSSLNLVTNCSPLGASGNGKVTGNPFDPNNPNTTLQNFNFSSSPNLGVSLVVDLTQSQTDGTLTVQNGSTPTVTDTAIDPSVFPSLVANTPFATSQCLLHNGELFNNSPACKLYTLTCTLGQGTVGTGPQCPTSSERDIVISDIFDPPGPLTLPDITYTDGNFSETFHQGFGFLMPSDDWLSKGGGPCAFASDSGVLFSCPVNLLTQFSGPGAVKPKGTPQPAVQSSFITVGPVPMYRTHIDLSPWSASRIWTNSHTVSLAINSRSPILPVGFNGGNLNGFVAAPLYSITYGVAPLAGYPSVPSTEFPISTDSTWLVPGGCPAPGTAAQPIYYVPTNPAPQLSVPSDGLYLVHFFATDCAGTEELFFRQDNSASWYTTFYTAVMFVDTVNPQVVSGPTLSCKSGGSSCIAGEFAPGITVYKRNSAVNATYQCSDDASGVATCGAVTYGDPITNPSAAVTAVDTSKVGIHEYKVRVVDQAGNAGATVSIKYAVI